MDDIRVVGRNTQGVRVMNLNEGDKLATVAKVAQRERSASRTVDGASCWVIEL